MSGFVRRAITLTVRLGKGSYGESGFDTVTLAGLRVVATIDKSGPPSMNTADVRVFGLTLDMMNKLSTLGIVYGTRNDVLTIEAGDAVSGMAVVFIGTIFQAYADLANAPESSFVFVSKGGALAAMKPIAGTSFNGQADVATIMAGLATQADLNFRNFGVTAQLAYPHFSGTARQQINACAIDADINWIIDAADGSETLSIWPKNGSRGGAVPVLSPATGTIGYPRYDQSGPVIQALYNPAVSFGCTVQVQSAITGAQRTWHVRQLVYDLASEQPGGPWFMTVYCVVDPSQYR